MSKLNHLYNGGKNTHCWQTLQKWGVKISVTRFGEIQPLCENFETLWLFFDGLFCIGQNFEPNRQNFIMLDKFSQFLMAQYWKHNLPIWSHWLCRSKTISWHRKESEKTALKLFIKKLCSEQAFLEQKLWLSVDKKHSLRSTFLFPKNVLSFWMTKI